MMKKRIYCTYCGGSLALEKEGEVMRDFCPECKVFYYDNPLPVASVIVVKNREVLLVRRKFDPQAGYWCLPMGFAESGESIETAALRELEEEAGIKGKITGFVNIESGYSEAYGDLLFVTFEAEWTAKEPNAGDDAADVGFFSFSKLPELAFPSNLNAIKSYLLEKEEYWAIIDSFSKVISTEEGKIPLTDYLSGKLIRIVEKNAEVISNRWLEDVRVNHTTKMYAKFDAASSLERNKTVIRQFRKWLAGKFSNHEIRDFYQKLGADRKAEGFALSEVLSALSLTRKHIWDFSLTQGMWNRTIDIYMAMELERHMLIFFDKAAYHFSVGYENT